MTINNRIKKLRLSQELTQAAFGQRIHLKGNSVALIEGGRNTSEQTIFAICKEFNVNERWLRTGEGEMFAPEPTDELTELVRRYGLTNRDKVMIEKFLSFSANEREIMIRYIESVAAGLAALDASQTDSRDWHDVQMSELTNLAPPPFPEEDTRDWRNKNPSEWTDQDEETAVAEFRQQWRDEKNRRQEAEPSGGPPADRLSG